MSKSKTILLVEDEAIIAVIHKRILSKYGFNVISVATGEKAVETAASTPGIDLILMDIDLGEGIDGTEAAQQILANKEIPLVFLSSHTEPEVVNKTEGITSYGYIVKNSGETVIIASIRMAFKLFDAKIKEREKEEQYRLISENTSDGIVVYEKGVVVYASPAYVRFSGYSINEILERKESDIPDFIHPDDRGIISEVIARTESEKKATAYYQFRYKHKNGHYIWKEDNASFIYDDEGNFQRVYVVARDISERKAHEERIKLMSEMLDEAPGAITVHDYDGNFLYANKNTYSLHGYEEDFLFQKLQDIDVPESAEFIEERMKMIDKEGEAVFKADHYRKDGTVVPLEVSAKKVNWGDIPAVLSIAVDITERLKAREALQESEEKYRVLFEDSPEAYLLIEDSVIIDCNRASLSLMRCDRTYIVGKSPCEFAPEIQPGGTSSREMMNKKIGEVYKKGCISFEFVNSRPDGTDFQAEVALSLVTLLNKPVIFASWRDISDKVFAINLMQKALNRFQALLGNSPSLIAIFDSEGRNIEVSKAMAKTYGLSPDQIRGKTFYDLLPAEIADDFMRTVKRLKSERKLIVKTDTILLNDEERIYESRLFPIVVEDEEKELFGSIAIDISDRIKAEKAVKLAEETYRNLFLNSQIGIFRSDVETGLILDANDTFARFAGYKDRESLLADSFKVAESYVDPQQRDLMISTLKETGEVNNFETLFKRIDDNLVWMRFSARHNSKMGWLEGVAEDITEPKKAADSLRENEELLQKIIDNIPLSLTIVTVEGTPQYANPQAIKLFQAESLENLRDVGAALIWENHDDRNKWLEALRTRGVVNNYEADFVTLSGERKFMLLSGLLIHYHGELCVLSIHSDITDRKLYEIALRESEEKYRMLFHYSPLGIYVADSNGNILDANDKLLSILGSPGLETTKSLNIFNLPLLDETGYADKFRESIEANTVSSIEFYYTSRWGKTTFASNYIVPVADSSGKVGKIFTLVEDVTVRKQNEDKIRALLQEKELLLKETHHRVKNNMNTVYGLLYMQSEELSDTVSKSIIMEAASRVQSMMVMYDKLYRSENHHEMNVNDYLPSLIDEIIRIFDSRIPVKTDINVDDIVLSAKALSALGIIINELITNSMKYAFDYMDEGLIFLSLTVQEKQVIVIYSDNGPGIPESVDFDNSTGFGMQLIGMLVQQLGGNIRIERGKGTRFVLEFDI